MYILYRLYRLYLSKNAFIIVYYCLLLKSYNTFFLFNNSLTV